MNRNNNPHITVWVPIIALLGLVATSVQVANLLINDRIFCANQGCAVVESTLLIPPLWFNAVGALYFLCLLLIGLSAKKSGADSLAARFIRLLLLCGMTAEGVLVAYQGFVVQIFCSYCLLICGLIVCMNILLGLRHAFSALVTFGMVLAVFSLLQFHSPVGEGANPGLDEGTYAFKEGPASDCSLYLLFSEDCPHCHRVMEMLDNSEARCGVRYNPIHEMQAGALPFEHMTPVDSYDPTANRLLLKMMGINTVPVLIEKGLKTIQFISGGDAILEYLNTNCLSQAEKQTDKSALSISSQEPEKQDECQVDAECGTSVDPTVQQFL